jgi:hypothetical protein
MSHPGGGPQQEPGPGRLCHRLCHSDHEAILKEVVPATSRSSATPAASTRRPARARCHRWPTTGAGREGRRGAGRRRAAPDRQLRTEGVTRTDQSGATLPAKVLTANAYLGALPMRKALAEGAQIVITGRCVDSAVTLGALMHQFGWSPDDFDRLAQGSLAGHIIECGCQATGGLHTDWDTVPDWAAHRLPGHRMSCRRPLHRRPSPPAPAAWSARRTVIASRCCTRSATRPLPAARRELRLHPGAMEQVGPDRVRVAGARGLAPGPAYKVSRHHMDGFRCDRQRSPLWASTRPARPNAPAKPSSCARAR